MVSAYFTCACLCGGISFFFPNVLRIRKRYKQVLEDQLLPFLAVHWNTHFLQDGAPLPQLGEDQDLLEWLAWKLSRLESYLGCLELHEKQSDNRGHLLCSELKEAILKTCTQYISRKYLSNLSNSMPRRMEVVTKNLRDMNKYYVV